ncbi:hypothetical protein [Mesorhizobium sp. B2-4-1]|uniref:hypothetical protein n=1 Tax=Mesorhizobium sp. B2-4-1 TaxID=2589948 RepID=UPI0011263314|nr:hypothetical protein [Mesorhizobium sp. B2-4-1]TPL66587.1 hypothetical protein FJ949_09475 [Mesorhizobium sp. B2-4-1]
MSYSKDLSRRLRHVAPHARWAPPPEPKLPHFEVKVPPHPQKYPNHAGHKGSVFGGICNRTACSQSHAVFYNRGTYGYYCADDAIAINRYSGAHPLCIRVDHNLTHEEMNGHTRNMYEEMTRDRAHKR